MACGNLITRGYNSIELHLADYSNVVTFDAGILQKNVYLVYTSE